MRLETVLWTASFASWVASCIYFGFRIPTNQGSEFAYFIVENGGGGGEEEAEKIQDAPVIKTDIPQNLR